MAICVICLGKYFLYKFENSSCIKMIIIIENCFTIPMTFILESKTDRYVKMIHRSLRLEPLHQGYNDFILPL